MINPNTQAGRLLAHLEKNFIYDPESGELIRINKTAWNAKVGVPVGFVRTDGYRALSFENKPVLLHRAIWLLVTKDMPDCFIDHANGIKDDNRWCNLRPATKAQNGRNQPARRDNKLGIKGVCFDKSKGKYLAQATHDKKHYFLGRYETAEDASKAYQAFAKKHHEEFYFCESARVIEYSLIEHKAAA